MAEDDPNMQQLPPLQGPVPERNYPALPFPALEIEKQPVEKKKGKGGRGAQEKEDTSAFDFSFFEPKIPYDDKLSNVKNRKLKARQKNLHGVKVLPYSLETTGIWAGYLGFKDTRNFRAFLKDMVTPVLHDFGKEKENNFRIAAKNGKKTVDLQLQITGIWKFILDMKKIEKERISSLSFPITATDLSVEGTSRRIGYANYAIKMHQLIETFPEHFPDAHERDIMLGLHSAENWHRAYWMIRQWLRFHGSKEEEQAQKEKQSGPAYIPLFLTPEDESEIQIEDANIDEHANYSLAVAARLREQDLNDSDEDEEISEGEATMEEEETSINQLSILQSKLNRTGEPGKEAMHRNPRQRPKLTDNQIDRFHTEVEKGIRRYVMFDGTQADTEGENGDSTGNLHGVDSDSVLQNANVRQTLAETGAALVEAEEKEFFEILKKTSDSSAKTRSFQLSCKELELDGSDHENITIPNSDIKIRPHQVIDACWMGDMENSPIKGGILASECGSGKTVITLLNIHFQHIKLMKDPNAKHTATIVVVPSTVLDVWYSDWEKFFGKLLDLKIFYGTEATVDPARQNFQLESIDDFNAFLATLDTSNPQTSATVIFSTYGTFGSRCLVLHKEIEGVITPVKKNAKPKTALRKTSDANGKQSESPMPEQQKADDEVALLDDEALLNDDDRKGLSQKVENYAYEFLLKPLGKIGRVVCDECHLIKNPQTLGAEAILRLAVSVWWGLSATPMINRVNDLRGFLIQLLKAESMGLNLPRGKKIFDLYNPAYDHETGYVIRNDHEIEEDSGDDFIVAEGQGAHDELRPLFPSDYSSPHAAKIWTGIEQGLRMWMLCPEAYRTAGKVSKQSTKFSRQVLRPILQMLMNRRLLSTPIELGNGQSIVPGAEIPIYTVRTVELGMSAKRFTEYERKTSKYLSNISMPEGQTNQAVTIKKGNGDTEGQINMESLRGLNHATFDLQLCPLTRKKRGGGTHGGAKDVQRWADDDDDHGATLMYQMTRPKEASYIPVPSDRAAMAKMHIAHSPKQQYALTVLNQWCRVEKERVLILLMYPMPQWDIEMTLGLLHYKVLSLCAYHTAAQRREIIRNFNDPNFDCDVLVVGMKLGSIGTNFHKACCKTLILELPHNISTLIQCIGRTHRIGQTKKQETLIITSDNTFDGYLQGYMTEKFIPQLIAEMASDHEDGAATEEAMRKEACELLRRMLGQRASRFAWNYGGLKGKDKWDPSHNGKSLDLALPLPDLKTAMRTGRLPKRSENDSLNVTSNILLEGTRTEPIRRPSPELVNNNQQKHTPASSNGLDGDGDDDNGEAGSDIGDTTSYRSNSKTESNFCQDSRDPDNEGDGSDSDQKDKSAAIDEDGNDTEREELGLDRPRSPLEIEVNLGTNSSTEIAKHQVQDAGDHEADASDAPKASKKRHSNTQDLDASQVLTTKRKRTRTQQPEGFVDSSAIADSTSAVGRGKGKPGRANSAGVSKFKSRGGRR